MFKLLHRIFRYLRILHEAESPWQINLAFYLGAFLGCLPFFQWLHLLLFLAALFLNISFPILLASFFLFYSISGLFDPFFHLLGHWLLTGVPSFLFAKLYVTTLFRALSLHHTITLGVTVTFLLLSPLYFWLTNPLVAKLMEFSHHLASFPILRFLLGTSEKEKKGFSLFRLSRIVLAFAISICFLLGLSFFSSALLKNALEKGMSLVSPGPVTIETVSYRPPLQITLKNWKIAESKQGKTNLLEVQRATLSLSLSPLFLGKFHIQQAELSNIQLGTPRTPRKEAKEKSEEKKGKLSLIFPDLSSLPKKVGKSFFEKEKLSSFEEIKKDKQWLETLYTKWETKVKKISEKFQEREKEWQKLLREVQNLSSLAQAKEVYSKIQRFRQVLQRDVQEVSKLRKEWKRDVKQAKAKVSFWETLAQKDWERLKKKYSLRQGGGIQLASLLFGEKIETLFQSVVRLWKLYHFLFHLPSREKVARSKGTWVTFPLPPAKKQPDFILKQGDLSLRLGKLLFQGKLSHLSSDPKLYGKDATLELFLPNRREEVKIRGVFTKNGVPKGDLEFLVKNLPIEEFSLERHITLKGSLNFSGTLHLQGNTLKGEGYLYFQPATFSVSSSTKEMALLQKALQKVSSFGLTLSLSGTVSRPVLRIQSDLDRQISSSIRKKLEKSNEKFLNKLRTAYFEVFAQKKRESQAPLEKLKALDQKWRTSLLSLQQIKKKAGKFSLRDLQKKLLPGFWPR